MLMFIFLKVRIRRRKKGFGTAYLAADAKEESKDVAQTEEKCQGLDSRSAEVTNSA